MSGLMSIWSHVLAIVKEHAPEMGSEGKMENAIEEIFVENFDEGWQQFVNKRKDRDVQPYNIPIITIR